MQFPLGFLEHLQVCDGFDEVAFIQAHDLSAPVSIRLNPHKQAEINYPEEHVKWSDQGYYLPIRPNFAHDPLFHAGVYYVQEASGMFIEYLLKKLQLDQQKIKALDLCAAPGGKSAIIASILNNASVLVSNEVIRTRVNILSENMIKWGNDNVIVTNNDPADFSSLENYFDLIVVDAPCSGSGLFRKDPSAMREWNSENVMHCEKRQHRILDDIIPCLKENGILIYTTCSYSKQENEAVINHLILNKNMQQVPVEIPPEWNIIQSNGGYRFYPDKIKGEGFFASVLKKTIASKQNKTIQNKRRSDFPLATREEIQCIEPFIQSTGPMQYFYFRDKIYFLSENAFHALKEMDHLHIYKPGTEAGRVIKNELIPAHDLAMSNVLKLNSNSIQADLQTALDYLKKNPINISFEKTGWQLILYKQIPLGWIKILQGRINNYYPGEWRLRK